MLDERGQKVLAQRQRVFDTLVEFIAGEGGWITSVRGATPLAIQAPKDSEIKAQLARLKYPVRSTGFAMRMVPHAIVNIEAGLHSSSPPLRTVSHAGLIEVETLELSI